MHHTHSISKHGSSQKRLAWSLALGLLYLTIVAIGSIYTDSLSLAANAAHMVIHNGAIIIGLIATRYAAKATYDNFSSGYNKAEALGGYTNAILLILMSFMILSEAVGGHAGHDHTLGLFSNNHHETQSMHAINTLGTILFASVGFLIHLISMAILSGKRKENLCVHGAYMCIKYDVLGIILAFSVGLIVHFTHWHQLDLIVGGLIGLMLMYNALQLLWKSGRLLLGAYEQKFSVKDIEDALIKINHIISVHNIIIRQEGSLGLTASAHLEMSKNCIKEGHWETCRKEAEHYLKTYFNITYCIFQLEEAKK